MQDAFYTLVVAVRLIHLYSKDRCILQSRRPPGIHKDGIGRWPRPPTSQVRWQRCPSSMLMPQRHLRLITGTYTVAKRPCLRSSYCLRYPSYSSNYVPISSTSMSPELWEGQLQRKWCNLKAPPFEIWAFDGNVSPALNGRTETADPVRWQIVHDGRTRRLQQVITYPIYQITQPLSRAVQFAYSVNSNWHRVGPFGNSSHLGLNNTESD